MPKKYQRIPMTHVFLEGLAELIKAKTDPSPNADPRPYDEATIERIMIQRALASKTNPELPPPHFSFSKSDPGREYSSPEELETASKTPAGKNSAALNLSLAESKALYAYAISAEGELCPYGSTEGVTESLFYANWLEACYGICLLQNDSYSIDHANRLERTTRGDITVTSSFQARHWYLASSGSHTNQGPRDGFVVIVDSQKRLVPVGKTELWQSKAKQAEEKKDEAKQPNGNQLEAKQLEANQLEAKQLEANQLEAKQLEAKQLEAKQLELMQAYAKRTPYARARAQIEQRSRNAFNLRSESLEVSMDPEFWKTVILPGANSLLDSLQDAPFTLQALYALIPCLCDPDFRKAFCEKLATRPPAEFERAVYWINQCYHDQPKDRAAIEPMLVNAALLKKQIMTDPTALGTAMKGCTLKQYNAILDSFRRDPTLDQNSPEVQQAYSSIPYFTRFINGCINGCQNFAKWLGSCRRKPVQSEEFRGSVGHIKAEIKAAHVEKRRPPRLIHVDDTQDPNITVRESKENSPPEVVGWQTFEHLHLEEKSPSPTTPTTPRKST